MGNKELNSEHLDPAASLTPICFCYRRVRLAKVKASLFSFLHLYSPTPKKEKDQCFLYQDFLALIYLKLVYFGAKAVLLHVLTPLSCMVTKSLPCESHAKSGQCFSTPHLWSERFEDCFQRVC